MMAALRDSCTVAIIKNVPHACVFGSVWSVRIPHNQSRTKSVKRAVLAALPARSSERGQVAQVVERSPEKAGVGGSTPSLATTFQSLTNNWWFSGGHLISLAPMLLCWFFLQQHLDWQPQRTSYFHAIRMRSKVELQ